MSSSAGRTKTSSGTRKTKTPSRARRVKPAEVTEVGRRTGSLGGPFEDASPKRPLDPWPKSPKRPLDPWPKSTGDAYRFVVDIDWSFPPPAEATRRIERQVRQVVLSEVAQWDLEGDLIVREVAGEQGRALQVAVRR